VTIAAIVSLNIAIEGFLIVCFRFARGKSGPAAYKYLKIAISSINAAFKVKPPLSCCGLI
jgi:hypothetical protein